MVDVLRFAVMLNKDLLTIINTVRIRTQEKDNAVCVTNNPIVKKIFEMFKVMDTQNLFEFIRYKVMREDDLEWIAVFLSNFEQNGEKAKRSPNTAKKRKRLEREMPDNQQKRVPEDLLEHKDLSDLYSFNIEQFVSNCDDKVFSKSVTDAIKKLITIRSKACNCCKYTLDCINHSFLDVSSGKITIENIPAGSDKKSYFVFLMMHMISGKKNETYIGISSAPVLCIMLINLGIIECSKAIKSVAPWWMPETIIGRRKDEWPKIFTLEDAQLVLKECYDETRGTGSKRDKAIAVAKKRGFTLWDKRILPADTPKEVVEGFKHIYIP